ncbi:hypothetical protein ABK040_001817 [Willaertia magna]
MLSTSVKRYLIHHNGQLKSSKYLMLLSPQTLLKRNYQQQQTQQPSNENSKNQEINQPKKILSDEQLYEQEHEGGTDFPEKAYLNNPHSDKEGPHKFNNDVTKTFK